MRLGRRDNLIFSIFTYIMVLVIPVVAGSIIVQYTKSTVVTDIQQINNRLLENICLYVDNSAQQIQIFSYELAIDNKVNSMANAVPARNAGYQLNIANLVSDLSTYYMRYPYIDNFYIYLSRSDHIITSSNAMPSTLFYSAYMDPDRISYSEWYSMLNNFYPFRADIQNENALVTDYDTNDAIAFVQTLPIKGNADIVNIVVLMEQDSIKNFIHSYAWSEGSILQISDRQYNPILTYFQDEGAEMGNQSLNESGYTVSRVSSSYNGWNYMYQIPISSLLPNINSLIGQMIPVIIVILLFGALFIIWAVYRTYRPINLILQNIPKEADQTKQYGSHNELEYIRILLEKKMESERELVSELGSSKEVIGSLFLMKILEGSLSNISDEMLKLTDLYGMDFPYSQFKLLIFRLSDRDADDPDNIRLKEIVYDNFKQNVSVIYALRLLSISSATVMALINMNEEIPEELEDRIARAVGKNTMDSFQTACIMVSTPSYPDLLQLSKAYKKALVVMESAFLRPKEIVLRVRGDDREDSGKFHYPAILENHMINNVKLGNVSEIETILDNIFRENFIARQLDPEMIQLLILSMLNTACNLRSADSQVDLASFFKDISHENDIKGLRVSAGKLFHHVSLEYQSDAPDNIKEWRINNIIDYIDHNLNEPSLSLMAVSEQFGITPQYLSTIFKNETGRSFLEYIRCQRIRRAKELLRDPKYTIEEISGLSGFNSYVSFNRSFKKEEGITPVAYRKSCRI